MRIERTDIAGLAILHWTVAQDDRGSFERTFCRAALAEVGLRFKVAQANISRNPAARTLRGLHFQRPPHAEAKIVTCLSGRIWDVCVDLRPDSATYRQWRAFELAAACPRALHLAAGLAHGYLTLEPDSDVHYLMDSGFVAGAAAGVRWDDRALAIEWPVEPALISDRDRSFPLLDSAR